MTNTNFKDWTLTRLDKAFGLAQNLTEGCPELERWQTLGEGLAITEFEAETLRKLQAPLLWAGKAWNEVELENKFISPLIMAAEIDDRTIGYFLERHLSAEVGDYSIGGIVDGMIAKGLREPEIPYFCLHEYKRSVDNQGNPDGQALAAMLVAQSLSGRRQTVFGLTIVGVIWNFMVLNLDGTYCISANYDASDPGGIRRIFLMIKALKEIIRRLLAAGEACGAPQA